MYTHWIHLVTFCVVHASLPNLEEQRAKYNDELKRLSYTILFKGHTPSEVIRHLYMDLVSYHNMPSKVRLFCGRYFIEYLTHKSIQNKSNFAH